LTPTWAACLFVLTSGTAALAEPLCSPFADTAETLDAIRYLDLPDPLAERVALPREADLLRGQIEQLTPPPLSKIYCDIGIFEMRIRFVQPAEDDAIAAMVTEAIYVWDSSTETSGWLISRLAREPLCARGDAPFASLCP
jgi:hypothetical protein